MALKISNTTVVDDSRNILNVPKIGINLAANAQAAVGLEVGTTDAVKVASGTTDQRPATAFAGYFRYNTTTSQFEGFNGTVWGAIGGAGATGGGQDQVFTLNDQTVTTSFSIPSGKNAGTFGPVTVANGAVVTIPDGSVWTIV